MQIYRCLIIEDKCLTYQLYKRNNEGCWMLVAIGSYEPPYPLLSDNRTFQTASTTDSVGSPYWYWLKYTPLVEGDL